MGMNIARRKTNNNKNPYTRLKAGCLELWFSGIYGTVQLKEANVSLVVHFSNFELSTVSSVKLI